MTFKDLFYHSYVSTHITHRKGEATLDRLRGDFPVWDNHFGGLLPTDRDARILDVGCGNGGPGVLAQPARLPKRRRD